MVVARHDTDSSGLIVRKRGGGQAVLSVNLGRLVREARLARSMSQSDLAGEDMSVSFLSQVEGGHSSISLATLDILARKLQRPLRYFFPDDKEALAELVLNDAREAMDREQPDECLRLLDEIEVTEDNRLDVLSLRGFALHRLLRVEEAEPILREAAQIADIRGTPRQRAETRSRLAICLYRRQQFPGAYEAAAPALEDAHRAQDARLVGKVAALMGHILYRLNEVDAARSHFEIARTALESARDLENLGSIYSGLSQTYRRQGDLNAALRYSRLAVSIFERLAWERDIAQELTSLAAHYIEAGDLEQAHSTVESAIAQARHCGALSLEAAARSTLANVLLQQGQIDEARREAEVASHYPGDEAQRARIEASVVLAHIAEDAGDSDQADALFSSAIECLQAAGDGARQAHVAETYSAVLERRGDIRGALHYSRIALHAGALKAERS